IQSLLHPKLTAEGFGPVAGFKIGCTTDVMQEYLKIPQPCAGAVFSTTVHHNSAHVLASNYVRLGVECEMAVCLSEDLLPSQAPYDRDSVAHAVGSVMAAMELVDDRYEDYGDFGVASLIADDFFNAGCVLGRPVKNWRNLDLPNLSGEMRKNGDVVGKGSGGDIMGHPLDALAWIANRWARRGITLFSGTFVLLGSLVQTHWLHPGDSVTISLESLGEVELRVD
ncbi:MAG: fumarylacetoacetate hydrolase family protein, partial [Rhodospirillales bacterium]|nr:fumarylacetoacetate hydrolase family protein [Rhodospirillales bacterium]